MVNIIILSIILVIIIGVLIYFIVNRKKLKIKLLEEEASKGNPETLLALGLMLYSGVKIDVDKEQKELREKLQSITNREPVLMLPNESPIYDKEYRQLLGESKISEDACFWLPEQPKLKACLLTKDNIEPQMSHYFPWLPEELLDVPFCAAYLEDSQVVSICRSVRIILEAEEAGIETAELYRRKGYAFHTLAEWAEAVRRNGSIPLYSASTSNLASLGLAKKAGGIFFGNGFCVC